MQRQETADNIDLTLLYLEYIEDKKLPILMYTCEKESE